MTLIELCEPLFQYICRLNRSARTNGPHGQAEQVRHELRGLFESIRVNSLSTPGLPDQYQKIRLPLVFAVDYFIRTGPLPFAGQWQPLAVEETPPIYTGEQSFFLELEKTMGEPARGEQVAAVNERLAVFYTCMGLGFLGQHEDEPKVVHEHKEAIAARIRGMMDPEGVPRICPEAYESLIADNLTEPPLRSLTPIGVALLGLILLLFIVNAYLYRAMSNSLTDAVEGVSGWSQKIIDNDKVAK